MSRTLLQTILVFLFLLPTQIHAKHLHPEKHYQCQWCEEKGGVTEYRLEDGTRVDCLLEQYAVEVDFARKWAESIGQALYYGLMTDREPAVLLILEKEDDKRYLVRLQKVAEEYGITVFVVRGE